MNRQTHPNVGCTEQRGLMRADACTHFALLPCTQLAHHCHDALVLLHSRGDVTACCSSEKQWGSGGRWWACHAHNGDAAVNAGTAAGGCEATDLSAS